MTNEISKKEIEEYKKHKPEQLHLFESDTSDDYSNTIELYDSMPKYWFGGVKREKGQNVESLPIIRRDFTYRKRGFRINISPAALIDEKTGKTIHYYPSQREELVEDVIRKLAIKKKGLYLDDEMAVRFTYYEVEKELKKIGHGYSRNEIKQAIEICNKSIIEIISKDGAKISRSSAIFPIVGKETKDLYGKERIIVMLHPLVTQSVNSLTYRSINYNQLMKSKMFLSRWLHKHISHVFSGVTQSSPYHIKLSNIVQNSGMKAYAKISNTIEQVQKSLTELKDNKVISKFEVSINKEGRKITEAVFNLFLTESFIQDIKKANSLHQIRLGEVEEEVDDDRLEILENELSKEVFDLPQTFIKYNIKKIKSNSEIEKILTSLKVAEDYIITKSKNCIPSAITKSAIRDGWKINNIDNNHEEEKVVREIEVSKISKEEKIESHKKLQTNKNFLKIKKEFKNKLDEKDYEKWFKNLEVKEIDNNKIVFLVPTKFTRDWIIREFIETKSKNNIKDIIGNIFPKLKKVLITCRE